MNETIVTGTLEFRETYLGSGKYAWLINNWDIANALDVEKYEGKLVKITIEEIPVCSNTMFIQEE